MNSEKSTLYALLKLIREQGKQIQTLQAMVGALLWLATDRGSAEKMQDFAVMKYFVDQDRPPMDIEIDEWLDARLLSLERELEQGRAEIPS